MPDEPSEKSSPSPARPGGLVLVSTPIGNLGDMSERGLAALRDADTVLCEDTRVTARLLAHFGVHARTSPLHDHNEAARTPGLLRELAAGRRIAMVSDAGTPLISDPGYRLVRAAIEAGETVTAVPGPNAAVMALTLSGLPPHPFLFLGFPPPRAAARRASFARLRALETAGLTATLIWQESPRRLAACLADLAAHFGPRPAAVARELTKHFEEVRRDTLDRLATHYATAEARGEIMVVVGPAEAAAPDEADVEAQLRIALQTMTVRAAADRVAGATGVTKRIVYAAALKLRGA